MKIGDLVRLHKKCINGGKLALIVEMPWRGSTAMKIMTSDGTKVCALTSNVDLISEAKEEMKG